MRAISELNGFPDFFDSGFLDAAGGVGEREEVIGDDPHPGFDDAIVANFEEPHDFDLVDDAEEEDLAEVPGLAVGADVLVDPDEVDELLGEQVDPEEGVVLDVGLEDDAEEPHEFDGEGVPELVEDYRGDLGGLGEEPLGALEFAEIAFLAILVEYVEDLNHDFGASGSELSLRTADLLVYELYYLDLELPEYRRKRFGVILQPELVELVHVRLPLVLVALERKPHALVVLKRLPALHSIHHHHPQPLQLILRM